MRFDDYLKLVPDQREAAYRRLNEHTRGIILGECNARLEANKAAVAANNDRIKAIYAECAAKPSTIAAAAERGCTPDEMAVRILGPMTLGGTSASTPDDPFISDDDNAAIQQLKAALDGR